MQAWVDKLVLNLSFDEVILAPVSSFSRHGLLQIWFALGNGRKGHLAHFFTFSGSVHENISFMSLLLDNLLERALCTRVVTEHCSVIGISQ
jgi:hypothetical protein